MRPFLTTAQMDAKAQDFAATHPELGTLAFQEESSSLGLITYYTEHGQITVNRHDGSVSYHFEGWAVR